MYVKYILLIQYCSTHIISDKFSSYVSANEQHTLETNAALKKMLYKHSWVNHSKNFVDPDTGAHTNSIEGCWEAKLKSKIKVCCMMSIYVYSKFIIVLGDERYCTYGASMLGCR